MKKIIFALVVLMLTTPVWGVVQEVRITCEQPVSGPNVIISYDNSMGTAVRGFALNIVVDVGKILEVECLSPDFGYFIYPGSIDIEGGVEPTGVGLGTCVCDDAEYDDTLPGPPDSNAVTIEMASLWSPNDPDHNEAPDNDGNLVRIKLEHDGCITITQNVIRAGVVMANPTSLLDSPDDFNAPQYCATGVDCYSGMADYDEYVLMGYPECWCYPRQCRGDADGLPFGKNNYWVSTPDLLILKAAWGKPTVGGEPNSCADFDHLPFGKNDYRVSTPDLTILKDNWGSSATPDDCLPGNREPPAP